MKKLLAIKTNSSCQGCSDLMENQQSISINVECIEQELVGMKKALKYILDVLDPDGKKEEGEYYEEEDEQSQASKMKSPGIS